MTANRKQNGDILLRGGKVVNVFTLEIEEADVAIAGGMITGLYRRDTASPAPGSYGQVIDLQGAFVTPGLIDAHIHIESTLLTPPAFAGAVVPHGTTAVIADPHEIANVLGVDGVWAFARMAERLPLDVYIMVPSCVPATPLETSGAVLDAEAVAQMMDDIPGAIGLAEVMNVPAVLAGDDDLLQKITAARLRALPVDGHAPGLKEEALQAYISAGVTSDHESVTAEEAWEKLRRGMRLLIREGSAAQNLADLISCIVPATQENISFCSDDRHPADLLREGHMNAILRKAVSLGVAPALAVKLATVTAARHYRLPRVGAVAPGYRADLAVFSDLTAFQTQAVFKGGQMVASAGKLCEKAGDARTYADRPCFGEGSVHLPPIAGRLAPAYDRDAEVRVIVIQPNQIVTGQEIIPAAHIGPAKDILPVAVVERHGKSGAIGCGLLRGFGLRRGAVASTVAHDSHNLIVVGVDDAEMAFACETLAEMGGGMVAVAGGRVLAALPLPVAGLMSDEDAATVARRLASLHQTVRDLGCTLAAPMMTLSFLALPVIPELKLTDQGLVDVNRFSLVPVLC
ncbi:adenine deaminase [Heliobacterium gestii]|uniref:Adenine deaminase n=1 Tax=Heliomicrobium gestii TaxID=2699 RepID=A0A845LCV9_HELGE|nr:adenine deaminase [Heliomicrobium gestii]MBM7867634.1 adenine deaminase [Heliomicrobium gestii]MZP44028.1 adenine deaminase [Heliomicrobium gestii]